jgi:hypothetical protein
MRMRRIAASAAILIGFLSYNKEGKAAIVRVIRHYDDAPVVVMKRSTRENVTVLRVPRQEIYFGPIEDLFNVFNRKRFGQFGPLAPMLYNSWYDFLRPMWDRAIDCAKVIHGWRGGDMLYARPANKILGCSTPGVCPPWVYLPTYDDISLFSLSLSHRHCVDDRFFPSDRSSQLGDGQQPLISHFIQLSLSEFPGFLQFRPLEPRDDSAYERRENYSSGPVDQPARPDGKVWVVYVYGIAGATCLGGGLLACLDIVACAASDTCYGRRHCKWIIVIGLTIVAIFLIFHGVALLSPRNLGLV